MALHSHCAEMPLNIHSLTHPVHSGIQQHTPVALLLFLLLASYNQRFLPNGDNSTSTEVSVRMINILR